MSYTHAHNLYKCLYAYLYQEEKLTVQVSALDEASRRFHQLRAESHQLRAESQRQDEVIQRKDEVIQRQNEEMQRLLEENQRLWGESAPQLTEKKLMS